MTLTPTYPGVYITEVPSGNRTLNGVATSITAFVGGASRGSIDQPVAIFNFSEFERIFGGLDRRFGLGYAVRDFYLSGGGRALVVRVAPSGAKFAVLDVDGLKLKAIGPGSWADTLVVNVSHPSPAEATAIAQAQGLPATVTSADIFTLEIRDGTGPDAPFEVFRNLTIIDGPAQVSRVLESSQWVRVDGAPPAGAPVTPQVTVLAPNRGSDGGALTKDDYIGAAPAFKTGKRGLYALEKADLVNLIVLPPPTPAGDLPNEVWVEALSFAATHRSFLIVDPPSADLNIDAAAAWPGAVPLTGLDTRNAAFFYPRIRHVDPLNGGAIGTFAPSGAVAGVFARTDGSRGVWKAPAGQEAGLAGVVDLAVDLTNDEQGQLNPKAVNVLRTFRDVGTVVWGARTLRGSEVLADDYKYVPVRRLALFLEESLYRGTQWVVFEPNDEPLWAQIRLSVGAFMHSMFLRGAFQGSRPRDAYLVKCDSETTTQYDIDRGIVNIQIGFAPLKPAEFVIISIQQKTASATA